MKIDPIKILLNHNYSPDGNIFFISGNEKTLIDKIRDLLISNLTSENSTDIQKIKNIKSIDQNAGLFAKKTLFLLSETEGLTSEYLNLIDKKSDYFIFVSENSPKTNSVKKLFLKQKSVFLIDCYELDKDSKTKILNNFLNDNNINLEQELFWYLVDILDNKYMLMEEELKKIKELNPININVDILKKLVSKTSILDNKIFFSILENNETIISNYNEKITNPTDANKMFFTIKQFTNLIIHHEYQNEFESNIPKYLFRERKILINIFKRFNFKKRKLLINLMFRTEGLIRKNNNLSVIVGLRFLLNLKKIITS